MSLGMPIDDFRYLLSMKANISDFQTLYDLKSNRVDTEQLMMLQSVLSRQLKHISVLLIEVVRISIKNPNDTPLNRENKKKVLLG